MPDHAIVKAALQIVDSNKYAYDPDGNRAQGWLDDDKMDCSEFVLQSYRKAGFSAFPVFSSLMMAKRFQIVQETDIQPGDIIYWSTGHVGIVIDPAAGIFAGSQTSTGPKKANYKHGYWSTRGKISFLRYGQ